MDFLDRRRLLYSSGAILAGSAFGAGICRSSLAPSSASLPLSERFGLSYNLLDYANQGIVPMVVKLSHSRAQRGDLRQVARRIKLLGHHVEHSPFDKHLRMLSGAMEAAELNGVLQSEQLWERCSRPLRDYGIRFPGDDPLPTAAVKGAIVENLLAELGNQGLGAFFLDCSDSLVSIARLRSALPAAQQTSSQAARAGIARLHSSCPSMMELQPAKRFLRRAATSTPLPVILSYLASKCELRSDLANQLTVSTWMVCFLSGLVLDLVGARILPSSNLAARTEVV